MNWIPARQLLAGPKTCRRCGRIGYAGFNRVVTDSPGWECENIRDCGGRQLLGAIRAARAELDLLQSRIRDHDRFSLTKFRELSIGSTS
jgi:hypothetical protein